MAKSVLMIAYHYPPAAESSGVQRALAYSRYLRDDGWEPIVLSAHPRAYAVSRTDQLRDIPSDIVVRRAFALDAKRHLALFGRYPHFAAYPDRWVSWWLGAVPAGWRLVRKYKPRLLWSTFPIATSHLVASSLKSLTGLPWVADFRDSMTEEGYPADESRRRAYLDIEQNTVRRASRMVFTAPAAAQMYRERYPGVAPEHFTVIPNGYDESSFADAERDLPPRPRANSARVTLVHSGILYPVERDPRAFYAAVASLKKSGEESGDTLSIVLRSSSHEEHHRRLIDSHGIGDIVSLPARVSYRDALREMLAADGLLVFQASNCNHQVPAKIYEYFRARRPILALTDATGDTAGALRDAGLGAIVPLDDERRIAEGLREFLSAIRHGTAAVASDDEIAKHSRRARTRALARLFEEVVSESTS